MGLFGDIWDGAKSVGKTAFGITPIGMGYNLATNEDLRSKIPGLNELTGAQGDAEKALQKKQEELAREAKLRRQQMQEARMNALGQSMLAFNPQNQAMAQMFGPQAAFSPEQFAQMAQNPMVPQQLPPELQNYRGTDPDKQAQVEAFLANRDRQNQLMQRLQPLPQGPQPLQMSQPAPARRY